MEASSDGDDDGALAPPSASPPDEQRLFRELCWLCGLPIVFSVAYAIWLRALGESAMAAMLGVGAMCGIAGLGTAMNAGLVRSALRWPRARDWLKTLAVAGVIAPVVLVAFTILEGLGFRLYSGYLTPYLQDGWPSWMGYVDVAVATPIAEELLFRGLIQPKLEHLVSPREALIVQAALFSAVHLSPVILVTHFVLGLAFGWLRRQSGSLLPGALLHGAWNAYVVASGTN